MSYSKNQGSNKGKGKKLGHEKDEREPISRPRIHEMIRCGVNVEKGTAEFETWRTSLEDDKKPKDDKKP